MNLSYIVTIVGVFVGGYNLSINKINYFFNDYIHCFVKIDLNVWCYWGFGKYANA
jgi:hypothetical protein